MTNLAKKLFKTNTRITFVAILLALSVVLCSCTSFDNFRETFIEKTDETTDAINIGVYEPMAGADKDAAAPEITGIRLAHKLYPTVGGKTVNLVYADNNSDITAAETAINTLLSKQPAIILGSYGNLYSLIASEYTEEAKVPAITMTNTNPLITSNNSYYFRICYIDATQGRLLARYIDSTDAETAGVLIPDGDDAAVAMSTAFTNAFEEFTENNDAIDYYEKYTAGATDYSEQLNLLKGSKAKYVLLPGDPSDAINIINQAAEMGLNVTFLGDMRWGTEDFQKGLSPGVMPNSVAFVQFFATDGDDDPSDVSQSRQEFLDAYYKEYGNSSEPEEAVALGYDAYMMALDAITKATAGKAQTASGEEIRDLLLGADYVFEGASGSIKFNKSGDPKKTAYISTWDKGNTTALYTIEADEQ